MRAEMPCSRRRSAMRSTVPFAGATNATLPWFSTTCSFNVAYSCSIAFGSPFGAGAASNSSGSVAVSSALNMPGGANVHQALPALRAEISSDSKERYDDASKSTPSTATGPSAPMAAASHPASRNSRSVASRSAMRVRTFSGLVTNTMPPSNSSGSTCHGCEVSAGISASSPAACTPSATRLSRDDKVGFDGKRRARVSAEAFTSASISNWRAGNKLTCGSSSMVRWSATAKLRMSVTSSPQNSIRTGFNAVVGNTSRMPPRTANSPRVATMSTCE